MTRRHDNGDVRELAPVLPEPEIGVFRTDRPGIRKVLGDLEAEIMEIMWARPFGAGVTVRVVFELLYARRQIAYTTVMTTMARLAKKHFLQAEMVQQTYVYFARDTREQFVSRFVGRILEDLLVGFAGATLDGIEALPDPRTVTQSRHLIEEIARRRAAAGE